MGGGAAGCLFRGHVSIRVSPLLNSFSSSPPPTTTVRIGSASVEANGCLTVKGFPSDGTSDGARLSEAPPVAIYVLNTVFEVGATFAFHHGLSPNSKLVVAGCTFRGNHDYNSHLGITDATDPHLVVSLFIAGSFSLFSDGEASSSAASLAVSLHRGAVISVTRNTFTSSNGEVLGTNPPSTVVPLFVGTGIRLERDAKLDISGNTFSVSHKGAASGVAVPIYFDDGSLAFSTNSVPIAFTVRILLVDHGSSIRVAENTIVVECDSDAVIALPMHVGDIQSALPTGDTTAAIVSLFIIKNHITISRHVGSQSIIPTGPTISEVESLARVNASHSWLFSVRVHVLVFSNNTIIIAHDQKYAVSSAAANSESDGPAVVSQGSIVWAKIAINSGGCAEFTNNVVLRPARYAKTALLLLTTMTSSPDPASAAASTVLTTFADSVFAFRRNVELFSTTPLESNPQPTLLVNMTREVSRVVLNGSTPTCGNYLTGGLQRSFRETFPEFIFNNPLASDHDLTYGGNWSVLDPLQHLHAIATLGFAEDIRFLADRARSWNDAGFCGGPSLSSAFELNKSSNWGSTHTNALRFVLETIPEYDSVREDGTIVVSEVSDDVNKKSGSFFSTQPAVASPPLCASPPGIEKRPLWKQSSDIVISSPGVFFFSQCKFHSDLSVSVNPFIPTSYSASAVSFDDPTLSERDLEQRLASAANSAGNNVTVVIDGGAVVGWLRISGFRSEVVAIAKGPLIFVVSKVTFESNAALLFQYSLPPHSRITVEGCTFAFDAFNNVALGTFGLNHSTAIFVGHQQPMHLHNNTRIFIANNSFVAACPLTSSSPAGFTALIVFQSLVFGLRSEVRVVRNHFDIFWPLPRRETSGAVSVIFDEAFMFNDKGKSVKGLRFVFDRSLVDVSCNHFVSNVTAPFMQPISFRNVSTVTLTNAGASSVARTTINLSNNYVFREIQALPALSTWLRSVQGSLRIIIANNSIMSPYAWFGIKIMEIDLRGADSFLDFSGNFAHQQGQAKSASPLLVLDAIRLIAQASVFILHNGASNEIPTTTGMFSMTRVVEIAQNANVCAEGNGYGNALQPASELFLFDFVSVIRSNCSIDSVRRIYNVAGDVRQCSDSSTLSTSDDGGVGSLFPYSYTCPSYPNTSPAVAMFKGSATAVAAGSSPPSCPLLCAGPLNVQRTDYVLQLAGVRYATDGCTFAGGERRLIFGFTMRNLSSSSSTSSFSSSASSSAAEACPRTTLRIRGGAVEAGSALTLQGLSPTNAEGKCAIEIRISNVEFQNRALFKFQYSLPENSILVLKRNRFLSDGVSEFGDFVRSTSVSAMIGLQSGNVLLANTSIIINRNVFIVSAPSTGTDVFSRPVFFCGSWNLKANASIAVAWNHFNASKRQREPTENSVGGARAIEFDDGGALNGPGNYAFGLLLEDNSCVRIVDNSFWFAVNSNLALPVQVPDLNCLETCTFEFSRNIVRTPRLARSFPPVTQWFWKLQIHSLHIVENRIISAPFYSCSISFFSLTVTNIANFSNNVFECAGGGNFRALFAVESKLFVGANGAIHVFRNTNFTLDPLQVFFSGGLDNTTVLNAKGIVFCGNVRWLLPAGSILASSFISSDIVNGESIEARLCASYGMFYSVGNIDISPTDSVSDDGDATSSSFFCDHSYQHGDLIIRNEIGMRPTKASAKTTPFLRNRSAILRAASQCVFDGCLSIYFSHAVPLFDADFLQPSVSGIDEPPLLVTASDSSALLPPTLVAVHNSSVVSEGCLRIMAVPSWQVALNHAPIMVEVLSVEFKLNAVLTIENSLPPNSHVLVQNCTFITDAYNAHLRFYGAYNVMSYKSFATSMFIGSIATDMQLHTRAKIIVRDNRFTAYGNGSSLPRPIMISEVRLRGDDSELVFFSNLFSVTSRGLSVTCICFDADNDAADSSRLSAFVQMRGNDTRIAISRNTLLMSYGSSSPGGTNDNYGLLPFRINRIDAIFSSTNTVLEISDNFIQCLFDLAAGSNPPSMGQAMDDVTIGYFLFTGNTIITNGSYRMRWNKLAAYRGVNISDTILYRRSLFDTATGKSMIQLTHLTVSGSSSWIHFLRNADIIALGNTSVISSLASIPLLTAVNINAPSPNLTACGNSHADRAVSNSNYLISGSGAPTQLSYQNPSKCDAVGDWTGSVVNRDHLFSENKYTLMPRRENNPSPSSPSYPQEGSALCAAPNNTHTQETFIIGAVGTFEAIDCGFVGGSEEHRKAQTILFSPSMQPSGTTRLSIRGGFVESDGALFIHGFRFASTATEKGPLLIEVIGVTFRRNAIFAFQYSLPPNSQMLLERCSFDVVAHNPLLGLTRGFQHVISIVIGGNGDSSTIGINSTIVIRNNVVNTEYTHKGTETIAYIVQLIVCAITTEENGMLLVQGNLFRALFEAQADCGAYAIFYDQGTAFLPEASEFLFNGDNSSHIFDQNVFVITSNGPYAEPIYFINARHTESSYGISNSLFMFSNNRVRVARSSGSEGQYLIVRSRLQNVIVVNNTFFAPTNIVQITLCQVSIVKFVDFSYNTFFHQKNSSRTPFKIIHTLDGQTFLESGAVFTLTRNVNLNPSPEDGAGDAAAPLISAPATHAQAFCSNQASIYFCENWNSREQKPAVNPSVDDIFQVGSVSNFTSIATSQCNIMPTPSIHDVMRRLFQRTARRMVVYGSSSGDASSYDSSLLPANSDVAYSLCLQGATRRSVLINMPGKVYRTLQNDAVGSEDYSRRVTSNRTSTPSSSGDGSGNDADSAMSGTCLFHPSPVYITISPTLQYSATPTVIAIRDSTVPANAAVVMLAFADSTVAALKGPIHISISNMTFVSSVFIFRHSLPPDSRLVVSGCTFIAQRYTPLLGFVSATVATSLLIGDDTFDTMLHNATFIHIVDNTFTASGVMGASTLELDSSVTQVSPIVLGGVSIDNFANITIASNHFMMMLIPSTVIKVCGICASRELHVSENRGIHFYGRESVFNISRNDFKLQTPDTLNVHPFCLAVVYKVLLPGLSAQQAFARFIFSRNDILMNRSADPQTETDFRGTAPNIDNIDVDDIVFSDNTLVTDQSYQFHLTVVNFRNRLQFSDNFRFSGGDPAALSFFTITGPFNLLATALLYVARNVDTSSSWPALSTPLVGILNPGTNNGRAIACGNTLGDSASLSVTSAQVISPAVAATVVAECVPSENEDQTYINEVSADRASRHLCGRGRGGGQQLRHLAVEEEQEDVLRGRVERVANGCAFVGCRAIVFSSAITPSMSVNLFISGGSVSEDGCLVVRGYSNSSVASTRGPHNLTITGVHFMKNAIFSFHYALPPRSVLTLSRCTFSGDGRITDNFFFSRTRTNSAAPAQVFSFVILNSITLYESSRIRFLRNNFDSVSDELNDTNVVDAQNVLPIVVVSGIVIYSNASFAINHNVIKASARGPMVTVTQHSSIALDETRGVSFVKRLAAIHVDNITFAGLERSQVFFSCNTFHLDGSGMGAVSMTLPLFTGSISPSPEMRVASMNSLEFNADSLFAFTNNHVWIKRGKGAGENQTFPNWFRGYTMVDYFVFSNNTIWSDAMLSVTGPKMSVLHHMDVSDNVVLHSLSPTRSFFTLQSVFMGGKFTIHRHVDLSARRFLSGTAAASVVDENAVVGFAVVDSAFGTSPRFEMSQFAFVTICENWMYSRPISIVLNASVVSAANVSNSTAICDGITSIVTDACDEDSTTTTEEDTTTEEVNESSTEEDTTETMVTNDTDATDEGSTSADDKFETTSDADGETTTAATAMEETNETETETLPPAPPLTTTNFTLPPIKPPMTEKIESVAQDSRTATGIAVSVGGGVVVPIAAMQQGVGMALMRMTTCIEDPLASPNVDADFFKKLRSSARQQQEEDGGRGGGATSSADDDSFDVLVHPLRFAIGDGVGRYARGAVIGNTIVLPVVWGLIAYFVIPWVQKMTTSSSHDSSSPLSKFRDANGWPSCLLVPTTVLSEGTAMCAVALLTFDYEKHARRSEELSSALSDSSPSSSNSLLLLGVASANVSATEKDVFTAAVHASSREADYKAANAIIGLCGLFLGILLPLLWWFYVLLFVLPVRRLAVRVIDRSKSSLFVRLLDNRWEWRLRSADALRSDQSTTVDGEGNDDGAVVASNTAHLDLNGQATLCRLPWVRSKAPPAKVTSPPASARSARAPEETELTLIDSLLGADEGDGAAHLLRNNDTHDSSRSNTASEEGHIEEKRAALDAANEARQLQQYGNAYGEFRWLWSGVSAFAFSLLVGVAEGMPNDTVGFCRARWTVAALGAVLQSIVVLTNVVPLQIVLFGLTSAMICVMVCLVAVTTFRKTAEPNADGSTSASDEDFATLNAVNIIGTVNGLVGFAMMGVGVARFAFEYFYENLKGRLNKKKRRPHRASDTDAVLGSADDNAGLQDSVALIEDNSPLPLILPLPSREAVVDDLISFSPSSSSANALGTVSDEGANDGDVEQHVAAAVSQQTPTARTTPKPRVEPAPTIEEEEVAMPLRLGGRRNLERSEAGRYAGIPPVYANILYEIDEACGIARNE